MILILGLGLKFLLKINKIPVLLYCIVLYFIVLYCIVVYCIVLYCTVLYCIVLSFYDSVGIVIFNVLINVV